ncbi:PREDICTED: MORN repeat-containing protein 3-like [Diuraphis noxia]|uniref:MORN repeat-containing protein 3-like n=1 Tax=Diuraphis noxia TaxID=143948 RepID=UPI0007638A12|nr:PREDICTED: MORN repeat-containing protein 3-like [Diuraphis noxia]
MPSIHHRCIPSKVQWLEQNSMKNGFKPGVYEKYGLYMGNWEHDRKQGELTISHRNRANGNVYDGQWKNGLKHGEGVYMFKDKGQLMDGVWIDGELKISTIKYFDQPDSTRIQYMMPEISKSDEKNILKAYEYTKSEILKNL